MLTSYTSTISVTYITTYIVLHLYRSKTNELQDLMSQPFPFDDKKIQAFWHSIQKYQGDLVVKGEEFSLYVNEGDGDQPTMDQITPLIDTCADLSYRLDAHARLCVQYTADQVFII